MNGTTVDTCLMHFYTFILIVYRSIDHLLQVTDNN